MALTLARREIMYATSTQHGSDTAVEETHYPENGTHADPVDMSRKQIGQPPLCARSLIYVVTRSTSVSTLASKEGCKWSLGARP